jgi:hypothetical protein
MATNKIINPTPNFTENIFLLIKEAKIFVITLIILIIGALIVIIFPLSKDQATTVPESPQPTATP